jgi:hypothetical protein
MMWGSSSCPLSRLYTYLDVLHPALALHILIGATQLSTEVSCFGPKPGCILVWTTHAFQLAHSFQFWSSWAIAPAVWRSGSTQRLKPTGPYLSKQALECPGCPAASAIVDMCSRSRLFPSELSTKIRLESGTRQVGRGTQLRPD